MRKLHHIDIVFENCQHLEIHEDHIGFILLNGFHKDVSRLACNMIGEMNVVDEVELEIFSEANEHFFNYGHDDGLKFDRLLKYHDIASIECYWYDMKHETVMEEPSSYYVQYNERDDHIGAPNLNQVSRLSSLGNLYISIHPDNEKSEDKWAHMHEFITEEEMENAADVNKRKRLINPEENK